MPSYDASAHTTDPSASSTETPFVTVKEGSATSPHLQARKSAHHSPTQAMERYFNEAPQDGGTTYGLIHHTHLESRLNTLTSTVSAYELQFNVQGTENV